jgi:hypothetical protein
MAEGTREQIRVHEQPVPHIPSEQTSGIESENEENTTSRKDDAETNVDISNKNDKSDTSNLHYEGNDCIYADPVTKHQYIWDSKKNEWVLRLDGKTSPEGDSKEESGESARKFESEVQNNTTLEGKFRCPPEEEKTRANDYEFDGESYFYEDVKTGKNELIPVERKVGLLNHCLGERNFQASFKKTFFLQEHLKRLAFHQDSLSILTFYALVIREVSSLLLV